MTQQQIRQRPQTDVPGFVRNDLHGDLKEACWRPVARLEVRRPGGEFRDDPRET